VTFRDKFLEYRDQRGHRPFDEEADAEFVNKLCSQSLSDFCRKIFSEIVDIERRLEDLENNKGLQ